MNIKGFMAKVKSTVFLGSKKIGHGFLANPCFWAKNEEEDIRNRTHVLFLFLHTFVFSLKTQFYMSSLLYLYKVFFGSARASVLRWVGVYFWGWVLPAFLPIAVAAWRGFWGIFGKKMGVLCYGDAGICILDM